MENQHTTKYYTYVLTRPTAVGGHEMLYKYEVIEPGYVITQWTDSVDSAWKFPTLEMIENNIEVIRRILPEDELKDTKVMCVEIETTTTTKFKEV